MSSIKPIAVMTMAFAGIVGLVEAGVDGLSASAGVCEAGGVLLVEEVLGRKDAGGADVGGTGFCTGGLELRGGIFSTADRDGEDGDV